MITREVYTVETDESHVFCRAALGTDQSVTIRFSKRPTLEQVKLAWKILCFSGKGAFGKEAWDKP